MELTIHLRIIMRGSAEFLKLGMCHDTPKVWEPLTYTDKTTRTSLVVCWLDNIPHIPPRCSPQCWGSTRPWWRGSARDFAAACGPSGTRELPPRWGMGTLPTFTKKQASDTDRYRNLILIIGWRKKIVIMT